MVARSNTKPPLTNKKGGKFDLSITIHYLDNNIYLYSQIVAYLGR